MWAIAAETWPIYIGAIATAVAAVGTVGAVFVALFLQPLRDSRQRPRLNLKKPRGSEFGVPGDSEHLYTVTLELQAERGKKSAEEVEILATATWASSGWPDDWRAGSEDRSVVVFENQPLAWYRSPETEGEIGRMHFAPGVARSLELLKVGSPRGLYEWLGWDSSTTDFFQAESVALAVPPKPIAVSSQPFVHAHLDWHMRFVVTARDLDAVVYEARLKVKKSWGPEYPSTGAVSEPGNWTEADERRVETKIEWTEFRQIS